MRFQLKPTHRTLQLVGKAPVVGTPSLAQLLLLLRGTWSGSLLPFALGHIAAPSLPHRASPRPARVEYTTGVKGHRRLATRLYAAMAARGEYRQKKPEVLSFEKDLSYELASLRKLSGKRGDHALRQRL